MQQRKKIVVIGASSGIGKKLTQQLLSAGHHIWAVARRRELLTVLAEEVQDSSDLHVSDVDISQKEALQRFSQELQGANFSPDVIVINAAIYQNDMDDNIDVDICENIMAINFLGAIHSVHALLPIAAKNCQFIAVSSSSSMKGSAFEGAGYAASKAALSTAFESCYLKWSDKGPLFTTVFYGPVDTSMRRTQGKSIFLTTTQQAVAVIQKAIKQRRPVYYQPFSLFFLLRLVKLLPSKLYLRFLKVVESRMNQD